MGNYQFGYDVSHTTGSSFHKETGSPGVKVGSYGLRDIDGRVRVVNYVADSQGFRADVQTNEPGVVSKDSAGVTINRTPSVLPLPAVGFTVNGDDDLSSLGAQEPGDGSADPAVAAGPPEKSASSPTVQKSPQRGTHAGDTIPEVPASQVAVAPAGEGSKTSRRPTPERGPANPGYPFADRETDVVDQVQAGQRPVSGGVKHLQYPPAVRPSGIGHGVPGLGAGHGNLNPFEVMLHPGYPVHGHARPEHPWPIPPFANPHGYGYPGQGYPYHGHPGLYPYLNYSPNHHGYAGPQWNYYDVPFGVQRLPQQTYAQAPFGYFRPALGVQM